MAAGDVDELSEGDKEDDEIDMAEEDAICRWVLESMEAEKVKGHNNPASPSASTPAASCVNSTLEAVTVSPAATAATAVGGHHAPVKAESAAVLVPEPTAAAVAVAADSPACAPAAEAAAQPVAAAAASVQTKAASASSKPHKIGSNQRRRLAKGETFCQAAVKILTYDCQGHVVKLQHHHIHLLL